MAISLLVGVSLEHFQLLRKFLDSKNALKTTATTPSLTTMAVSTTVSPLTTAKFTAATTKTAARGEEYNLAPKTLTFPPTGDYENFIPK